MIFLRRIRQAASMLALAASAWLGLVAFDILRLAGFRILHGLVRRCPIRRRPRRGAPDVEEIVWAVDEACVWYVKAAACLQRSAVATWLLRRHGLDATLVIGCRPAPFESHAWVEVGGRIVNDRPQYQKFFAVLERL